MSNKCQSCSSIVCTEVVIASPGYFIDIGGLAYCLSCYNTRRKRKTLPCEVCGKDEPISQDPLITSQVCRSCEEKADLRSAWNRARNREPCDLCRHMDKQWHHATVYGQNLCHSCYKKKEYPCTQVYPGDRGYPIAYHEQAVPAIVRSKVYGIGLLSYPTCYICKYGLKPDKLDIGPLPTICKDCRGPKWWDYMKEHRKEWLCPDALYAYKEKTLEVQPESEKKIKWREFL